MLVGEPKGRKPILTGLLASCACTAGRPARDAVAAPPSSMMNSRRCMCSPQSKDYTLPHRCRNAALCITTKLAPDGRAAQIGRPKNNSCVGWLGKARGEACLSTHAFPSLILTQNSSYGGHSCNGGMIPTLPSRGQSLRPTGSGRQTGPLSGVNAKSRDALLPPPTLRECRNSPPRGSPIHLLAHAASINLRPFSPRARAGAWAAVGRCVADQTARLFLFLRSGTKKSPPPIDGISIPAMFVIASVMLAFGQISRAPRRDRSRRRPLPSLATP